MLIWTERVSHIVVPHYRRKVKIPRNLRTRTRARPKRRVGGKPLDSGERNEIKAGFERAQPSHGDSRDKLATP